MKKRESVKMNKFEVALLLDGTIRIYQGEEKDKVAEELSQAFKKEALESGKNRSESFRSIVGIKFQLNKMEGMFFNPEDINKSNSWQYSKLFNEIIDLYNTDHKTYFDLLKKAKAMYSL